jgi:pyruvate formate lyase activating enzyme
MIECQICQKPVPVSKILPVCLTCLRDNTEAAEKQIQEAHGWRTSLFGLPANPPRTSEGVNCNICANNCKIPINAQGYCGLRRNENNRLVSEIDATHGLMHYYLDPHVTNCCGAYFCPGGTGIGYPKWACQKGSERGYYNLAVFFYGCGLDCLFCQNASHKQIAHGKLVSLNQLTQIVEENQRITCICYFGGSPEPQLPFTLKVMDESKHRFSNRILRQCFEMNGYGNPSLIKKMGTQAAESGGIIKFDLKAFSSPLHRALCGVSNEEILSNFSLLAETLPFDEMEYPPLMATTLLVPYYIDETEVAQIARFIKELNQPSIEYSLLIFHPDHLMRDLPVTPIEQAQRCYDAAKKELGKPPHIGNLRLLGGKINF